MIRVLAYLMGVLLATGCGGGKASPVDAGTVDGDVDGDSDTDSDSDTGGDGGADAGIEKSCVEGMVYAPLVDTCIDSHEYSNERFVAFLNERKSNDCQGHPCRIMGEESIHCPRRYEREQSNGAVDAEIFYCEDFVELGGGVFEMDPRVGDFPVGWVTWHGADEACRWEGKRLCTHDEWYAICSHGGAWHYPYGGTTGDPDAPLQPEWGNVEDIREYQQWYTEDFLPKTCLTGSISRGKGPDCDTLVGAFPDCEGSYPGIFDMTGNAGEWVAKWPESSDIWPDVTLKTDYWLLGGAFSSGDTADDDGDNCCWAICTTNKRMWEDRPIGQEEGFRCCGEPLEPPTK